MANYYEILGLKNGADILEIKAAFRQLAKLYHPDVNPEGKERFTVILKAYEVLSDPNLKYSYDYKLNAGSRTSVQKEPNKKDKNWRFDEREMKRRQYYNEHIRKYEKKYQDPVAEPEPKSSYNEFKYILFATPLAVALFLGIMTFTSGRNKVDTDDQSTGSVKKVSGLKMGDAPYLGYFGQEQYELNSSTSLKVNNFSGDDLLICLFSGGRFVRSFFIESGFSASVAQLPNQKLQLRYSTGRFFNEERKLEGTSAQGAFTDNLRFFAAKDSFDATALTTLSILPGTNEGFEEISAAEFFKKGS